MPSADKPKANLEMETRHPNRPDSELNKTLLLDAPTEQPRATYDHTNKAQPLRGCDDSESPPADEPLNPEPTEDAAPPASTPKGVVRTIYLNKEVPMETVNKCCSASVKPVNNYCSNSIKTSKYSIFNFFFKSLWEQFRRFANIYFLFIGVLQTMPATSTTQGTPTIALPLTFVLVTSMLKEAIEDFRRHKKDNEINNTDTERWDANSKTFEKIKWKEVQVHDILKVNNGEEFAADMIVLDTADDEGIALVQTVNLDGETNLKKFSSLAYTRHCWLGEKSGWEFDGGRITTAKIEIEAEPPSARLDKFQGSMKVDEESILEAKKQRAASTSADPDSDATNSNRHSLNKEHLLMRGAKLKATPWAVGLVVYTGKDSRVVMNSGDAPSKMSQVENITNKLLVGVFFFQAACCFLQAVLCGIWHADNDPWYLQLDESATEAGVKRYFTFMILLTQLIPISLYVTMEIVKFLQIFFMQSDLEMYWAETDRAMECRTSNLNEELGMIKYIFSDKTGTLTQNCMDLKYITIDNVSYGKYITTADGSEVSNPENSSDQIPDKVPHNQLNDIRLFTQLQDKSANMTKMVHMMAVCNTVQRTDEEDGRNKFEAESPDECAFVYGASAFGVELSGRESQGADQARQVVLQDRHSNGEESTKYDLLHTLDFSSSRQRMSVIVRTPAGKIQIWCKGADSRLQGDEKNPAIIDAASSESIMDFMQTETDRFSEQGLRTLWWAYKDIDDNEYSKWSTLMVQAENDMNDREKRVDDAYDEIEKGLKLLGATAVEDQLQHRVPETIELLRGDAGIKIWMLTGDKTGTAIQIAQQCKLIVPNMPTYKFQMKKKNGNFSFVHIDTKVNKDGETKTSEEVRSIVMRNPQTACVIERAGLQRLLDSDDAKWLEFQEIAVECAAVVVARVSPEQKAKVCNKIKDNHPDKPRCLSIGDGANDVPMIQAAHVGVGIAGVEGMQAVQASDYAIAQFSFLGRLLLVHGRWSYIRITMVICYSFYKNIAYVLPQYWWGFQTASSGQKFYSEVGYQLWNIGFSALPVFMYGLFEQDVSALLSMKNSKLYQVGPSDTLFSLASFARWVTNAVWHSLVLSLVPTYAVRLMGLHNGQAIDGTWPLGALVFTCSVIVINVRLMLETRFWIWAHWFCFAFGVLTFFIYSFVISLIHIPMLSEGQTDYGVASMLYSQSIVWFTILLTCIMALVPDIGWILYWFTQGLQGGLAQKLRAEDTEPKGCFCGSCCLGGQGCVDHSEAEDDF